MDDEQIVEDYYQGDIMLEIGASCIPNLLLGEPLASCSSYG